MVEVLRTRTPLGAAQHGAGGVARGQVALARRVQVEPVRGRAPHREHAQAQLREHRRAALRHLRHLRADRHSHYHRDVGIFCYECFFFL